MMTKIRVKYGVVVLISTSVENDCCWQTFIIHCIIHQQYLGSKCWMSEVLNYLLLCIPYSANSLTRLKKIFYLIILRYASVAAEKSNIFLPSEILLYGKNWLTYKTFIIVSYRFNSQMNELNLKFQGEDQLTSE